jgi:hypothetical protein
MLMLDLVTCRAARFCSTKLGARPQSGQPILVYVARTPPFLRPPMKLVLAGIFLVCATAAALAQKPHPCAADAIAKATPLLRLHFDAGAGDTIENVAIDNTAKVLAPVQALKGKGKLDVLEVWGHIYKADYRMRFIYAQIKDSCALMGQEILEASDPY